ncbi:D-alanyl-D-alanine carboxypeptidase family protein [Sarcina sp. DSM 11001]|uniref:D-alanyl-D-alanine carboxypeptidase family protein n=1 Tax=Sarcina sp. DSM 11001 TaxID=1798184 RepID=UPI0015877FD9|nr:D-alanyl-D-alanine carboxypeptidase family protein [Sarcina sp. DSM 11001]
MEMIKRKLLFPGAVKLLCSGIALAMTLSFAYTPVTAIAKVKDEAIYNADGLEDYMAEREKRKSEPIQTNSTAGWPEGPRVGAAGAVIMDADSGEILYGKNIYKHLYPASITKLMTALLAYENLDLADHITFSENAVYGIEIGSSNIGMDVGQSITVEEALYGLLIASANEVAIALGEKVSGSEKDFADLMNERARQLGCENTNFVTLNGLHDRNHYTCAYDMALIARQVYQHTDLIRYMSDYNYHFVKSEKQPDDFWISNTNDFLTGEMEYDGIVGGKTGYTDQARETLVTFAEREDVHLICVIMKEEPPYEYYDTIDLLNYAFDNFTKVNIKESERKYTLSSPDFLSFGPDIFGKSEPAYRIEETSSLMIPKKASFSDLDSEIIPLTYETASGQDSGTASTGSAEEQAVDKPDQQTKEETDKQTEDQTDKKAEDKADKQTEAQAGTRTDSSTGLSGSSLPEINRKDGSRLLGQIHYSYHGYDLTTADVLFLPVQKKLFPRKTSLTADNSGEGSSSGLESSSLENAGLLQEEGTADSDGTETVKQDESTEETNTVNAIQEEIHGIRAFFFNTVHTGAHGSIYINILVVLPLLLIVSFFLCVFFFINSYFARLKRMRMRKTRRTVKKPAPGSPSNRPSNPSGSSRNRRGSSTPTFRGRQ